MITSKEARDILRYRITLLRNTDKILKAAKKSEKANENAHGQLSMFDVGLVKESPNVELDEYEGHVHEMDLVNMEKEVIGLSLTFDPLEECEMYKSLYCTNEVDDVNKIIKAKEGIVIMDYITKIKHLPSRKGNMYARIETSELANGNFFYLFGDMYKDNIRDLFINQIYLIELTYNEPSLTFDRDSLVIDRIKNIKDVDITREYERIMSKSKSTIGLNEPWMIKNRKK